MKSFKNSLIALLILTGVSIFAQGGDPFTNKSPLNSEKKTPEMSDYLFGEVSQDYKIISSNSVLTVKIFQFMNFSTGWINLFHLAEALT